MSGLTYILWIAPTITSRLFDRKNAFRIIVLDGLLRDGGLHVQRNALNILNVVLSDVSVYEGKNSKNSVSQTRMRPNYSRSYFLTLRRTSWNIHCPDQQIPAPDCSLGLCPPVCHREKMRSHSAAAVYAQQS